MTQEDALRVAKILIEADGGCSDCYLHLFSLAAKAWPEIDWLKAARATKELTVLDQDFIEAVHEEVKP